MVPRIHHGDRFDDLAIVRPFTSHDFGRRCLALLLIAGIFFSPFFGAKSSTAFDQPPTTDEVLVAQNDDDDAAQNDTNNKTRGDVENPFPKRFPSPSLDGGTEWLNVGGDITLDDLKGKVVLLDFWTFCCINCMHVLPDLAYLEEKYKNELVVIGVHSAKFENEKDSENIKNAILRYEIKHPVINDSKMTVWRKFNVSSWPTFVLIDPEGFFCGAQPGEGNRELLDTVIGRVVAYHKSKGTLDESPVHFDLERHKQDPKPLRFPGKIYADVEGNRLFITDSGHNRIIITDLDGQLLDIIGNGAIGRTDGDYATASFDHPQGVELVKNVLYVADTENHMLREVDLESKRVSTLAGTGKQAHFREDGGPVQRTALNSPWDLRFVDGTLYIAMAGPHQIWKHRLGSQNIDVYAGNGREDIINGTLATSSFAQPSSLATDGNVLFVADSEGSSIRAIDIKGKRVTTVAGAFDLPNGATLFEFGDRDGSANMARLQHPLAVALAGNLLYIADSYNHKIKVLDLDKGVVRTELGTGDPGSELSPIQFSEPGGLAINGQTLYIADTNNHRILKADRKTGEVELLEIAGLTPPDPPTSDEVETISAPDVIEVDAQTVSAGENLKFEISVNLPEEYKLNAEAPASYRIKATEDQSLIPPEELDVRKRAVVDEGKVVFNVPVTEKAGSAKFQVQVSYGYCRDGKGGLCKLNTSRWEIPVVIDVNADQASIELKSVAE
ncbi:MAG: thioredoxin-like domain-containing protein [Planctomycetota bacterium]|nr:thioredoxin-like domain-containing protein [Planctomycetota bacterium]MDA1211446.1 thioredoxin-like domain-containing protein [Planctomycetota bacterium]